MLRISEQFHASDLGRQRQGNEDNYFVRAPLFVVADGMGGAQAGVEISSAKIRQSGGLDVQRLARFIQNQHFRDRVGRLRGENGDGMGLKHRHGG